MDVMNQAGSKRRNFRTGLLLAVVPVAVFFYTIWAIVHGGL